MIIALFTCVIKCHRVSLPLHRQEALLAAISEKDANIALLELSSSKKKKTQDEVAMLKREKDRLVQQLKQQVGLLRHILCYFFLTPFIPNSSGTVCHHIIFDPLFTAPCKTLGLILLLKLMLCYTRHVWKGTNTRRLEGSLIRKLNQHCVSALIRQWS